MYQDYFTDVLAYYRAGQKSATLPQRLMRPTPASIRDECLAACQARFHIKDSRTLTAFFKVESDENKLMRSIRNCDLDRFRPLVYLLTGRSTNTDDLNIELLAWLIDFPGRPFKLGEYQKRQPEGDSQSGNELKTPVPPPAKWFHRQMKNKIAVVGVLLFLAAGLYIVANRNILPGIDSKISQKDILPEGNDYLPVKASPKLISNLANFPYSRCNGASPCKACSNCKYCNWCNSGGTCSICAPSSKKVITQKRASQCQATTRKGTQCSRAAKKGSDYCWQHG